MYWAIDGTEVHVTEWTRRGTDLDLTIRTKATAPAFDALRALGDGAGEFTAVVGDGGAVEVFGLGARDDSVTVTPLDRHRPHLEQAEYYVRSYNESPADDGSIYYDASLSLARRQTRALGSGYADPAATATDWEFALASGRLAIDQGRVAGGEKRARQLTLRLQLTPEQAAVILETLGTVEAVTKQSVPDGDDFYVDNHPEDRNTIRILPPDNGRADEYLLGGAYVVTDWRVASDATARRWTGELTVVLDEAVAASGQYGAVRYGHVRYGHADD